MKKYYITVKFYGAVRKSFMSKYIKADKLDKTFKEDVKYLEQKIEAYTISDAWRAFCLIHETYEVIEYKL